MGSTAAPVERNEGSEQAVNERLTTRRRRGRPPTRADHTPPVAPADTADTALDLLSFGTLLKVLRERRGLSQGTLAEHIGKSTSLISLFESDQRRPTSETVGELVSALRLNPEEQRQLVQAAGFAEGDVSGAIRRVVEVLGQHLDLGDAERTSLRNDLDAQLTGWQALYRAVKRLSGGEMDAARRELERLAKHSEFSPTLTTQVRIHLAGALSQAGQLGAAGDLMRATREQLEYSETTPGWLPWQEAEVKSKQAVVALRQGDHELAVALLNQCVRVYDRLLVGTAEDEQIAFAGLGLSYKQLAEVHLLQGEPAIALRYCANAEAHFSMARRTALVQQWVRRTLGLKAWACSLLNDFDRAETLRQQVRALCEEAHDRFGLAKNALYRGDDYRRHIKIAYLAACDNLLERDPETRQRNMRAILRRDDLSAWLELAESCYQEALVGLKETGERLLLGRCHRNLGIILRYRAIRDGNEGGFDEARGHLDQALGIEQSNGQDRRMPGIYEAIAELEWDRGNLISASAYYDAALEMLESSLVKSPDFASEDQRKRVHAALEVLHPVEKFGLPRPRRMPHPHMTGMHSTPRWRELCGTLVHTIREYIALHNSHPVSFDHESAEWEEMTLELDVAAGPRILAQNRLSTSLALRIPGGYVPEAAARHIGRFHSFAARVQTAKDPRGSERSRDLCCRADVARLLTNPHAHTLTLEQVRTAAEYLERFSLGYRLDSSLYRLPLGFAVKGNTTLVEIPERLALASPSGRRAKRADMGAMTLCYAFESEELAQKLRLLFDQLVEEAGAEVQTDTETWLKEMMEQVPRVRRESIAM